MTTTQKADALADEQVWIWSDEHQAYWRPEAAGYTRRASKAGIYSRTEAESLTGHCGPEKRIEFEPIPAALRQPVDRDGVLRELIEFGHTDAFEEICERPKGEMSDFGFWKACLTAALKSDQTNLEGGR